MALSTMTTNLHPTWKNVIYPVTPNGVEHQIKYKGSISFST